MKVMLMYPNLKWGDFTERTAWTTFPYNLGILASMIRDKHDVSILDANADNLSRSDLADRIREENPEVLGISVLTDEYSRAGFVAAQTAKETKPSIKTIVGGGHATSLPRFVIKNKNVDYVVAGEGEYVFMKLCSFLGGAGSLPEKGILYRSKNGRVIDTGRSELIMDLDKIPYPSYDKIEFMKYASQIQRESVDRPREMPYARIVTSRGCPFSCCFCEVGKISGKRVRLRSLENVAGEIELLKDRYGIKSILFDDDNLIVDKNRAKNLFKMMIDKRYDLKWNAPTLALYNLDEEMIGLMKDSGCQFVNVAIESGVERVLKDIIHKPLNLKQGKKMIKKLKEYSIDTAANFVIGFPGETWNEIRQTIKFAEETEVDYVKIAIATPLPNTELYRVAKDGGHIVRGFRFDRHLWTEGWIKTSEFEPKDLKILRAYEWDRINFTDSDRRNKIAEMMGITEKRLNEIRRNTLDTAK